jgi:hypothetical protein
MFKKYVEKVPGKHSIDCPPKKSSTTNSHVMRKVLQSENSSVSGGVHHWLKSRSTREKITCDKRT